MMLPWRKRPLTGRGATYRFGVFEADLAAGELRRNGSKVRLQEQPFQVLSALLEAPGGTVTREELQRRLWPTDPVADVERGLNKAINRLREALGDNADDPQYIETLPQRGYRLRVAAEAAPAPVASLESIAVLPLENLSGDPSQEYFSDGLTDELIGEIARINSLRVISRTSVMRYKLGIRKSLPAIAQELNVDAILEGTVLQAGGKVRITAQLIRARDDRHLWSERYERHLDDVISVQGEVARAVAREIQVKLTAPEETTLARTRSVSQDGYQAFLKGNFLLYKGIPNAVKSIDYFTESVRLDPLHAEAHASLAQALCLAGIFGLRPSSETHPAARAAAARALELDPSNASAYNVLAEVKKAYDWDLEGALPDYRRALQLNPSHLMARLWYSECLARLRRYDDALAESDRALALDPVSPLSLNARAMTYFRARRYGEAIRTSQQALELDSHFATALWWQGMSYAARGELQRALDCLTRAVSIADGPLFRALLGHLYGRAARRAEAQRILAELEAFAESRYVTPVDFALVHAGLGDADMTFRWLEKAYQTRATRVHELPSMYFDQFQADPRYSDLLQRVGLPPADDV